jgi:NAD(P)H-dependent flavin oxidoreductase YrpB (nitropropane dioxygenase family)
MFKTRMTELFGIKHPIMLAGMNWITDPKLVSAVCNAGGLGILARVCDKFIIISGCLSLFPKIFPAIAHDIATQS